MSLAHVLTVGGAAIDSGDLAGRLVARALLGEGRAVASRQVLDEDEAVLDRALEAAMIPGALVVILASPGGSGGDIVRRTLARAAGTRLVLNETLLRRIEDEFARRERSMPHRHDRLALLPQGAVLLPARAGQPGWMLEARGAMVAVLPLESAHDGELIGEAIAPLVRRRLTGEVILLRTLLTTGLSPGDAEDRLARWLGKSGPVAVSSVIVNEDVWVRLLARGGAHASAAAELQQVESDVRQALGEDCYGADEDALEGVLGRLLVERSLTVSVAESCTGGLLGHRLTNVSGSSRYFERGVIVYSNRAKEELLGVPEALLRTHGAVSAEVADAMVTGICGLSQSRCGLAVTGIAGPDGGTPTKPVGTVYIAVASPAGRSVRHFRFAGGRDAIKWRSAQSALDMLRRQLLSISRDE
jgi:competence/damage-inducible protein CinA-like protein